MNLAMPLGSSLAQSFTSLAATSHVNMFYVSEACAHQIGEVDVGSFFSPFVDLF